MQISSQQPFTTEKKFMPLQPFINNVLELYNKHDLQNNK